METWNKSRNVATHVAEETLRLPEDIIQEIFSRLPVKSLLRYRCVSKYCRSMIDNQCFVKTHLEHSTKNKTFAHHGAVLNRTPMNDRLKLCSLGSLFDEPVIDLFDDSINIQWRSVLLVGSCNGLVCVLLNRRSLMLCNPSTRMSKILPDIDRKINHGHITKYGFGYEESSGDYKVFAVMSTFCPSGVFRIKVKVYSLKANSWKARKDKDDSPFDGAGKFANGKLYWDRGCDYGWGIVSFDLKNEVYGLVKLPSYIMSSFDHTLGMIGECLSVLCRSIENRLELWMMKQYGLKESWDKVVDVPLFHFPSKGGGLTPFCIGSNGEILFTSRLNFVIYYPKNNEFRFPRTVGIDSFGEAVIFIESLVSPVSDGD